MSLVPDLPAVLRALAAEPGVFLLDSSDGRGWSYLGVRPSRVWSGRTLADWEDFRREARPQIGCSRVTDVPFPQGLVGAVSYDFGLLLEGIVSRHSDELAGLPLFSFGYYDSVLAVDHIQGEAFLCGLPGSLSWKILKAALKAGVVNPRCETVLTSMVPGTDHDEADYVQLVLRALELIRAGEIYEVNGSRRFALPFCGSSEEGVDLYQRLRANSPVPYGGYWSAGPLKILSASPELFLGLKAGRVSTRPMKGTRPRSADPSEDERYRRELEESGKEKAELLMVTDLLRNDLGRVCRPGSVAVRELRTIEPYHRVFQATACVEGVLRAPMDVFDLLEATFPGGSVTGCPKHRAVQVIDDLERSRRGYYTGALGYISCCGDMSLNVLIRTIVLANGQALFSAGGGIVADSDPVKEFEETALKAEGMCAAF